MNWDYTHRPHSEATLKGRPLFAGLLPPVFCLLISGGAAWGLLALIRRMERAGRFVAPPAVFAIYFLAILSVAFAAGFIALWFSYLPVRSALQPLIRRVVSAAVWLAPALVLVRLTPLAALAAGVGLALILVRCLRDFYVPRKGRELKARGIASVGFHASFAAFAFDSLPMASLFVGVACFAILWDFGNARVRTKRRALVGASPLRLLGNASAALVLTMLVPLVPLPIKKSGIGVAGVAGTGDRANPPAFAAQSDRRNLHSGVILRLDVKPSRLLAPMPHSPMASSARPRVAKPLSIPFTGEYWFYYSLTRLVDGRRIPLKASPPESSLVEIGNPLTWTMTSMNQRTALVMKAHQPVEPSVELSCCRGIDVAIHNEDTDPQTISLELVLLGSGAETSLGEIPVPQTPGKSIISFSVPANAKTKHFDAIEVMFHLAPKRQNQSVSVAIDRFDLQPRL